MKRWDPDEGNDPGRSVQPLPWQPKYAVGHTVILREGVSALITGIDRENCCYRVRMSQPAKLTEQCIDNHGGAS